MNSGSFDAGMLGLTNWVGNAVMPILAVLILALGIFKYSRGYHIEPYIAGADVRMPMIMPTRAVFTEFAISSCWI